MFPHFRRLRMLRNWGGIVDVTPDRSPIIGRTPVPGLFVNCGWGTGGFKATPGSGHVFAATIAGEAPHPIAAPFSLDRFASGRLIDEAAAAAVAHWGMLLIRCPWCGDRPEVEFRYAGEAHVVRPADPRPSPTRPGPLSCTSAAIRAAAAANAGGTCMAAAQFFNALRDTATDRFAGHLPARRSAPISAGAADA